MRTRAWLSAAFLLVLAIGAGSCRKYVTEPLMRRPVITSIVAFPTVLAPGDSTLITINATDPDGDPLVYDWDAVNGLVMTGPYGEVSYQYFTQSPSMVFHRSPTWPGGYDTAYVWCSVRDRTGGSDSRRVRIYYSN